MSAHRTATKRTFRCKVRYALVTPARDEAGTIRRTLEAVVAQTKRPICWVIVDDGSTDGTASVVRPYAERHAWIKLTRVHTQRERDFASKAHALREGIRQLQDVDYELLGNLDADISFGSDYFERLTGEFARDPRLGVAGGLVHQEIDGRLVPQDVAAESVAGAVQLMRREAFEATSGYQALPAGGEDALLELEVRSAGWKTRTISSLQVRHDGPVLSGNKGRLQLEFNRGLNCYLLGYHPLFVLAVGAYRSRRRPWILSGASVLLGFLCAALRRRPRVASPELIRFLRREQSAKLRRLLRGNGLQRA